MSTAALYDYQLEAINAVHAAAERGEYRPFVALPTGSGKNYILPEIARQRGGRMLVIAHSERILNQTMAHFERAGLDVGLVKSDARQYDKPIVVASIQTLARPGHVENLGGFRTTVIDEAHHGAAKSYVATVQALGAGTTADRLLIGMSATPYRGDGLGLDSMFGAIVYERNITDMIRAGRLCDLRGQEIALGGVDLDTVTVGTTDYGRDFKPGALGRVMESANAAEYIVQGYQAHAAGRFTIAFAPTVAFAQRLAEAFCQAGIPAETMTGETSDDDRNAMLDRYRRGEIAVITNCGVLLEGFDAPRTDCVLIARPTKSRTLFVQMVGRATRRHPEKQDALILSFTGATARHSLMSINSLYGLQGTESVLEADVRRETEATERATAVQLADDARRKLIAANIDLLRQRRIRWAADPDGRLFSLSMGQYGCLDLVADRGDDTWSLIHVGAKDQSYRERKLATKVALDEAMRRAEIEIDQRGARQFCDSSNPWLDHLESPAQTARLAQNGIPPSRGRTKRDAGEQLTLIFARQRRERRASR
jgi:ATP-dependent helicase IRC3